MFSVHPCAIPHQALLRKYVGGRAYTDCYCVELPLSVSHAQYVSAFYTTWIFKLERLLLRWLFARPSLDSEAHSLGDGDSDRFAAWEVEARAQNQLLMCDFQGRTRSWLMLSPLQEAGTTRLHFGSAVIAASDPDTGEARFSTLFHLLIGFHKLYSRILLQAAKTRLLHTA